MGRFRLFPEGLATRGEEVHPVKMIPSERLTLVLTAPLFLASFVLVGCHDEGHGRPAQQAIKERSMLTPLMTAASKGELSSVEELLRKGADPNVTDKEGYTALHYAAHCGERRVVQALLARGANVNARTHYSVTPLLNSIDVACNKPEITLSLISAGADVNAAESNGDTALWIATTESSVQVMEALLKHGADPNVRSRSVGFAGDTPLHMAAMNGLYDAVVLLLRYGADGSVRNAQGQTPLDVVPPTSPETKRVLVEHARPH